MDKKATIRPTLPLENPTLSYWQTPPDPIANTRTTPDLPTTADYIIIGSGISGACIAFNLLHRQPHAKILMLEARGASSGASGRNGGHTKAASYRAFPLHAEAHGIAEAVKIARMELENIKATHDMAERYEIKCESRPCRTVDVVYDERTWRSGVAAIGLMREAMGEGDEAAEYVIHDAEAAREKFLVEGEGLQGAFEYAAGSVSAYKFTVGVLKLCLERGLNLQTFTPVTAIDSLSPGIWTAQTPRGAVATKNLILATNGYTAHLLPLMQSKIVPLRGQITAHRPGLKLRQICPDGLPATYSFMYSNGYEYMIARPRHVDVPDDQVGDVIIGGGLGALPEDGVSEFGNTDDTQLNDLNSEYLYSTTARYFGSNWGEDDPEGRIRTEWTGIMGITGDGTPYVGPVPGEEGLSISAGFNGHGMVLCLKSAEALAHMICGEKRDAYEWFPESFIINEKRLHETMFEGRKGMRAPPEVAGARFKKESNGVRDHVVN